MNAPEPLLADAAIEFRRERDQAERTGRTPSLQFPPLSERAQSVFVPAYKGLKVLDGAQLLTANFPPRDLMLAPWLPDKGLAMIFAPRGVGKTWIALSIAHAIASGGESYAGERQARDAFSTSMAKCQR